MGTIMTDEGETPQDAARHQYHDLINAYGSALVAKDPTATELFAQATAAWERLRAFKCEESELEADMHLVAAFSFAIQARDRVEAKRLYDAMSEAYRATTDAAEAIEPGSLKIWLRQ